MKSQTKAMALKAEHFGHKVLALALATALAAPLSLGAMASRAFADEPTGEESTEAPAPADQEATLTIHGIDFMNPTAEDGLWDLFRVDNGEGKNIYIEVEQDGKVIAPRFTYTIVEGQNTDAEKADTDYAGTGDNRIAQIVALKIAQASDAKETPAAQSLQQAFADPAKFPSYTVKVYNAKRQGDMIYQGTVHPVYAKLVADDGTEEWKVLGIRTEGPEGSQDQFADTIGAGTTYYKNIGGDNPVTYQCVNTNEAGDPVGEKAADGKSYVVTYQQVAADAVSGALKYVDENGAVVDTEIVEDLGTGKDVAIKKSFFKSVENPETGEVESHYYRVIQRLNGSTITLTPEQATKQVRVMEVKAATAGAYQVTIKYVDENGKLLWTDGVDVKGEGYQYTLPNSFSVSAVKTADGAASTDRSNDSWGVNYYTLASWTIESNAVDDNEAIGARNSTTQEGNPVVTFEPGEYPAGRTVTAQYASQATTQKVNLTVMEIDGETGNLIDKVQYEVTPTQSATYTPARKSNGMVPWSGNMDPITYAWEDLEKGTDVLQYVYYVSEDYVPGDAYDITVQYMNIANSEILRTETITVDPEANDYVSILGEETFSVGNETYVRLGGQETALRHSYLSPARTYTIYYRDVNDELSANITVRRTQIVDTERVQVVPGTTVMTAAPVAAAPTDDDATPPAADGTTPAAPATVDAGVGAGDASTVINDDDNPLANLNGQDTTTERTIVDDENPLYSGLAQDLETTGSGMAIRIATGVALLVAAGIAFWWLRRRNRDKSATDSMNA